MKREIKQLIRRGCAMMEQSKGSFEEIYEWMFSHGEKILAEGNDGFRTYSYTYNRTKAMIEEVSAALYKRIGATGQYVALEMENCIQWIVGFWAILRSGNKPYLVNCRHPKALSDGILKTLQIQYILALQPSKLQGETLLYSSLKGAEPFGGAFENEIAFSTSATSLKETVCFYTGKEITKQLLNVKGILKNSKRMAAHFKGSLKNLAFLEIFTTNITDYSPLLGCTGLEDLNLGNTYGDPAPITQMTWLKNLWMIFRKEGYFLSQALPDTRVVSGGTATVDSGWRDLPNYFAMRDALKMYYMSW